MQTIKRTVSKAKPNSEDHFLTKLSLNSQAEKKAILAAEKLFSHNLRKSLPSLIPSTKIGSTEKPTVTQNLRQKLSESSPGTTKRIWTDEKRLRHKKKSLWIKKIAHGYTQPAITCSKLTTETLEQVVKYVQS